MATINISDLKPTGSELFSDSEGYMNELGDDELEDIYGGIAPLVIISGVRVGIAAARSSPQCAAGIAGGLNAVGRWWNNRK